jgi:hypothetical protein
MRSSNPPSISSGTASFTIGKFGSKAPISASCSAELRPSFEVSILHAKSMQRGRKQMMMHKPASTTCAFASLFVLAACTMTPQPTPGEIQREQMRTAARDELKDSIDAYNTGDYNGSLKTLLDSKTIWITDNDIQLEALRYSAFDYCLTNRANLCKQQFEKALKLDPDFDLRRGEKGHPLWEPAFDKAKKAVKE